MERIFVIRDIVDSYIEKIVVDKNKDLASIKKNEYTHSYGVASIAQLLAEKRGLRVEIAAIIGHLHDIARIMYNILDDTHAEAGAKEAEKVLISTGLFDADEINIICGAITQHSNKAVVGQAYEELIKDADIMERYLWKKVYMEEDKNGRIMKVKRELNLI